MDVSIIIPAYNAAQTIAASVASVLAAKAGYQIEILVVDDASNDDTWARLLDLSAQYPELKPLKNNRRKGPSGARNTGLDVATGKYIAFLDADDVWYDNHLRLGVEFLQRFPEQDAILFDQDILDAESGKKLSTWITEKNIIRQIKQRALSADAFAFDDNIALALLNESFLHLQTLVVKSSAVGRLRFDEDVFRSEDVDFGIHLYLSGCHFAYSTVATGIYYRNPASLTAKGYENDIKTASDRLLLLQKYRSKPELYKVPDKILKPMICERLLKMAYPRRKLGQKKLALQTVTRSFAYGISSRQFGELIKVLISFATK
jgi:glycosyltransferase involved in cell wall biosynthesis